MKVIKNFYDKDKFEEIQKLILGSNFPFYFTDGVADPEETNDFYFTHTFYNDYQPTSPYYKILIPIIDMIKPKSLVRIKANLYPRTEQLHHHKKHEDFDFDLENDPYLDLIPEWRKEKLRQKKKEKLDPFKKKSQGHTDEFAIFNNNSNKNVKIKKK